VIEGLISLLSGGITGVVGSGITKYAEYKTKQLDLQGELSKSQVELQQMQLETQRQLQLKDKDNEVELAKSADQVLSTSFDADAAKYLQAAVGAGPITRGLMATVDFIRGLMRPLITIYLISVTSWIVFTLYNLVERLLVTSPDSAEMVGIWAQVVNMVLYLTATAVTWWFGSRPASIRRAAI